MTDTHTDTAVTRDARSDWRVYTEDWDPAYGSPATFDWDDSADVEQAEPGDTWDAELDRIVAEQVLAHLSAQHRTVLALRYMDDCTVSECAEMIGRTVHATEALLVRARRAFRAHYPTPEGGLP